jgi:uncharacterized protein YbjT (DUF2867 family)
MRVFVAGATGAIGERLVPQLIAVGHDVAGTTRNPEKADELRALGATRWLAEALGAKPPMRVPRLLARLLAGPVPGG